MIKNLNYYNLSEILCKIGIILVFVILIFMILRWCQQRLILKTSIAKAKKNDLVLNNIPQPPSLQFFGRSRSETIAINVFASILHEKGYDWRNIIVSYRPEFLKNPKTNRCMEIDAFFPDLNLGIEYNGIQHYKFPNHLHKTKEEFEESLERDKLKLKLAKENNIRIISIPYYVNTCKLCNNEYKFTRNTDQEKWELIKEYLFKRMIFIPNRKE